VSYQLIEPNASLRLRLDLPIRLPVRAELAPRAVDGTITAAELAIDLDAYATDRPEWESAFRPTATRLAAIAASEAAEVNDWESVERFARIALAGTPNDPQMRSRLVQALHASRQHAEAAAVGLATIDDSRDHSMLPPGLFVHTAESLEGTGRTTDALRLLDAAASEFPDDPRFGETRAGIVQRLSATVEAAGVTTAPRPDSDSIDDDAPRTQAGSAKSAEPVAPGHRTDPPTDEESNDGHTAPDQRRGNHDAADRPPRLETNRPGPEPRRSGLSLPAVIGGLLIGVIVALVLLILV